MSKTTQASDHPSAFYRHGNFQSVIQGAVPTWLYSDETLSAATLFSPGFFNQNRLVSKGHLILLTGTEGTFLAIFGDDVGGNRPDGKSWSDTTVKPIEVWKAK